MASLKGELTPGDECSDCGTTYTSKDWRRWRRDPAGDAFCGICSRDRGLRD